MSGDFPEGVSLPTIESGGIGTSFSFYEDGEGNLTFLRVQRTGRRVSPPPPAPAPSGSQPVPHHVTFAPRGSVRRLVLTALAEIAVLVVLGTALTAYALAQ